MLIAKGIAASASSLVDSSLLLMEPVLVGAGAVTGALVRWKASSIAANHQLSPWGTLAINTVGSFLLGAATQSFRDKKVTKKQLLFLGTGFCGSFTTYSTFSVDVVGLLEKELFMKAFSLMAITNIFGISAALVGFKFIGHLNRNKF